MTAIKQTVKTVGKFDAIGPRLLVETHSLEFVRALCLGQPNARGCRTHAFGKITFKPNTGCGVQNVRRGRIWRSAVSSSRYCKRQRRSIHERELVVRSEERRAGNEDWI